MGIWTLAGNYALSFVRHKKARPITEAALMAALNIRANYSFRSAAARRRGGSLLARLWQYWFLRLTQEPNRAAARGAALSSFKTTGRRFWWTARQCLSSAPEWNSRDIFIFPSGFASHAKWIGNIYMPRCIGPRCIAVYYIFCQGTDISFKRFLHLHRKIHAVRRCEIL